MPAALRIRLAPEEDYTLSQLQIAALVPQRTRKRAHMLRLNAQGWAVGAIAEIFECHEHTVRATIRRWRQQGVGGLWEAPGRGTKWKEEDMQYLEQCLEQQERTINSMQLATVLEQERQVKLSAERIRRILQKRASDGNARDTVSEQNKTLGTNAANKRS